MRSLSQDESSALDALSALDVPMGSFILTATGSEKSIVDANASIRAALAQTGLHDYDSQRQGQEWKVYIPAIDLTGGERRLTRMSAFRPETKDGDPRFWVYGMKLEPDRAVGMLCLPDQVVVVDLSTYGSVAAAMELLREGGPRMLDAAAERSAWTSYLPERAFGGREVAAIPGIEPDRFWPEAPSAAGADEAIAEFRSALDSGNSPRLLFLVGGPGNGKSMLSSRAVRGLKGSGAGSDMPAARSYEFEHDNGSKVLLINDATIRYSDEKRHGLVEEVERALGEGLFLLANANRGILLESLASASGSADRPGSEILRWVAGLAGDGDSGGYTRSDVLSEGVTATAVFLDMCSLLEARPAAGDARRRGRYEVHGFRDRDKMAATPAGDLLRELVYACDEHPDDFGDIPNEWNPIAANLASLRAAKVRHGFESILRAAEIASGSRLTFRELWGVYARSLMGGYDRGQPVVSKDLVARLDRLEGEEGEFDCILELSRHRLHQALFYAGTVSTAGRTVRDPHESPATGVLQKVDPVLDAVPGWCSPVNEALELRISAAQPPLRNIADRDPDVAAYAQDFDFNLEDKVLGAIGAKGDVTSQRLQSWYGQYLARLYAVAKGIPAFATEIDMWTTCWRQAREGQLPVPIYTSLQTLLLPNFADTRNLVLPALESRTVPLRGRQESPILVAKLAPTTILLTPRVRGDEVLVRLVRAVDHTSLAELSLDLAMVREIRAVGAGEPGVTDAGFSASPRLERARSSLLSSANRPLWAVASGGDLIDLDGISP